MELTIHDTNYYMDAISDNHGEHYLKDGIAVVLDFRNDLHVVYRGIRSVINKGLLCPKKDSHGNTTVAIPISTDILLYINGLFYINMDFIKQFKGTSLSELVKDKQGCYAVSGFEVIHGPIIY